MYDITQRCLPGVVLLQPIHTYLVLPYSTSWDLYLAIRHLGVNPPEPSRHQNHRSGNDGPPNWRGMTMPWKNRWYSRPCRPLWSYSFLREMALDWRQRPPGWLAGWCFAKVDHVAFFLSAILAGAGQSTVIKNLHERFRQIQAFAGGDCISPTQNQVSLEDFPTQTPTFFEASLQQTQMFHNFSKHSWNKQFSGESIRVFKIPAPSFHQWWPRNSTPRPCIGSIWDLEGKEFIRPLEEIPKQPLFGCIKPSK